MFQPVPFLARVAAAAHSMAIGTGVLLLTLLNSVECAENAAMLDAIAGGGSSSASPLQAGTLRSGSIGMRRASSRSETSSASINPRNCATDALACPFQKPSDASRPRASGVGPPAQAEVADALHTNGMTLDDSRPVMTSRHWKDPT